jgi:hypothetical protein
MLLGIDLPGAVDTCRGDDEKMLDLAFGLQLAEFVQNGLGLAGAHLHEIGDGGALAA